MFIAWHGNTIVSAESKVVLTIEEILYICIPDARTTTPEEQFQGHQILQFGNC